MREAAAATQLGELGVHHGGVMAAHSPAVQVRLAPVQTTGQGTASSQVTAREMAGWLTIPAQFPRDRARGTVGGF